MNSSQGAERTRRDKETSSFRARRVASPFFVTCPAEFFAGPTLPSHARNIFVPHAHPSRFHAPRLCERPRVPRIAVYWFLGGCRPVLVYRGLYTHGLLSPLSFSEPTRPAGRAHTSPAPMYTFRCLFHRREKNRWSRGREATHRGTLLLLIPRFSRALEAGVISLNFAAPRPHPFLDPLG